MPSGSTRVTVTLLYSFPLTSLKSSATATVAKHRIKKGTTFILHLLERFLRDHVVQQKSFLLQFNEKSELIAGGRNMMIVVIAATHLSSENRIMKARTINRIELVYQVARFGFLLALSVLALSALFATGAQVKTDNRSKPIEGTAETTSLK